jgi:anti-sigma28 factor (negative regulator of flagellin synthesis)
MKIDGSSPYRPADQVKRAKKTEKSFEGTLKQSKKTQNTDSVNLGSNLSPVKSNYTAMHTRASSQGGANSSVDPIVRQVLDSPEAANSRVQEIKQLISEGGAEAYFKTIDSEKIAEKLLNSGVLDEI